jgi:XapX domain-containing protein
MTAILSGLLLGLAIGAACRWFDLPLPAPPRLVGALLVLAMTLGFLAADLAILQFSPAG